MMDTVGWVAPDTDNAVKIDGLILSVAMSDTVVGRLYPDFHMQSGFDDSLYVDDSKFVVVEAASTQIEQVGFKRFVVTVVLSPHVRRFIR